MIRASHFAALSLGVLLALVTACSKEEKEDKVIMVGDDDAEMNAAMAKARETLPQFWQVFEKPEHGESDFGLKVAITDKHGTEYFWTTNLERSGSRTTGIINNDPGIVATVKLGQRVEIPEADIADWLYMRDDKIVGNHTIRPLFKQMSAEEVEKFKSMMADP